MKEIIFIYGIGVLMALVLSVIKILKKRKLYYLLFTLLSWIGVMILFPWIIFDDLEEMKINYFNENKKEGN